MQDGQDDGSDWFGQNAPPSTGGASFGNPVYDQIAQMYRSAGHEPTQEDVSRWGTNIDARYLAAIGQKIREQFGNGGPQSGPNGTTPPPTPAPTNTPAQFDENAFWSELEALPANGDSVRSLAAKYGYKVLNAKGDKIQFADGRQFDVGYSFGDPANARWQRLAIDSNGGGGQAAQGGFTPPAGSQLPDFVAPTGATEQNDPGYAFRLQQGEQALKRAQSASGTSHTGGAIKDLTAYDQNYASGEFGNVFNRALQDYGTKYGKANDIYQRGASEYDRKFGNLFSLSQLDSSNNNAYNANQLGWAGLYANTSMNGANAYGNYLGQGANANAAGTIGQSNAWNSLFSSIPKTALDAYYASVYGQNH